MFNAALNFLKVLKDQAHGKSQQFRREDGPAKVNSHYNMVLDSLKTLGRQLKSAEKMERLRNGELKGNEDDLRKQK